MSKRLDESIRVRIDADTHAALLMLANRSTCSVGQVVREALREHLAEQRRRQS